MQVGILGPLEVRGGGAVVPVGGARLRTLLVRLALDVGRPVPVDALAEALWPVRGDGEGPAGRTHALHSVVSRLRRALPAEAIRWVPGGYRLDLPPDAVDGTRFEQLAGAGRRALREGRTEVAAGRLREALALWRGDALADVADAPFAAAAVARLDELRLAALEDRAQADLLVGTDPTRVVAELRAVTAAHPGRERAQALLLRALHADGRGGEALAHFAELRADLADRLGVDPSPELSAAHLAVLRAGTVDRSPRQRGNLRSPLTGLVGREEEQALVVERLAGSRLVTLTGPGGAGKTRLAMAVAADLGVDLRGGAWLVELAPVVDPAGVGQAVLAALGGAVTGSVGRDPADRIDEAVPTGPTLLVLDNCEHVLDAAATAAEELLGRCPALRVLATSREPLGITGEALVPVPPLRVAGPAAGVAEIRDSPAVSLFAERAAAAHPGFAVTADNAAVVAGICRRLDGLPLAIELAAARTRSTPVEHLAAVLDDRFRLLVGGSRTALPRHRTLAAVVGWSWELLTDDERGLVEALSVFPGTVTADAAQHVDPAARGPSGPPTPATLAALVDKSLLQVVDAPDLRYRMLETIREYGMQRLVEQGEVERARAAHARWFLHLAETAAPHLRGPAQLRWIPTLRAERDNLLGALRTAVTAGDADTAVRLASASSFLLTLHGDHALAVRLLRSALDLPATTAAAVRAPAVAAYLLNSLLSGGTEDAPAALDRFRAASGSGHPSAFMIGPLVTALSAGPGADLAAIGPSPHTTPFGRAMSVLVRALLRGERDLVETCRDLAAAAEQFAELGERWGTATSLTRLGIARTLLGDAEGAVTALRRARRPAAELGDDHHQRVWLAAALVSAGDTAGARAELRAVVAAEPAAHHLALARMRLGDIERWDGGLAAAAREYGLAREAAGPSGESDRRFAVHHRAGLAHLAMARGDTATARTELLAAHAAARTVTDMALPATVASGIAALCRAAGRPATAAVVLGAAHSLRGSADALHPDIARLTRELRQQLGAGLEASYERGRALDRSAVTALLDAELAAPGPAAPGPAAPGPAAPGPAAPPFPDRARGEASPLQVTD